MAFRQFVVLLALAVFASCSSGSTVIGPLEKDDPSPAPVQTPSTAVASFKRRVTEDGEELEEKITIDPDKETVTMHVGAHGGKEEVDIIRDFKQNLTICRIPAHKVCLLGKLDDKQKSPAALLEELEEEASNAQARHPSGSLTTRWQGSAVLQDRSVLSDEMAQLCAKFPIYQIQKANPARRARREWCLCRLVEYCVFYSTHVTCYYVEVCVC